MRKFKWSMVLVLILLALSACSNPNNQSEAVETGATQESVSAAETEPQTEQTADTDADPEQAGVIGELLTAQKLADYFSDYADAAMLIYDGTDSVVLNETLADQELYPFSTFKIPNSLIALETGVVTREDSFREWDGTVHSREEINQDQTLDSAFKHSCVWYYQDLARSIGADTMQKYLDQIAYGNCDISGGIDQFWLGTSLQITPRQQLDFIYRLYTNDLPFSLENMEYVREIMKQEGYPVELYGKTGSSGDGLGWFVGYVVLEEQPYFFTTVIRGADASGLAARDITAEIFAGLPR